MLNHVRHAPCIYPRWPDPSWYRSVSWQGICVCKYLESECQLATRPTTNHDRRSAPNILAFEINREDLQHYTRNSDCNAMRWRPKCPCNEILVFLITQYHDKSLFGASGNVGTDSQAGMFKSSVNTLPNRWCLWETRLSWLLRHVCLRTIQLKR